MDQFHLIGQRGSCVLPTYELPRNLTDIFPDFAIFDNGGNDLATTHSPLSVADAVITTVITTALRREASETEDVLRQKCQNSCRYLSRRPDTDEKELGRLSECGRHRENRRTTIVQRSYKGRCHLQTHQPTSEETKTLWW